MMQLNVDLHVIQTIHGIEIHVNLIQEIQNHVHEVYRNMQQQKHDMEHLLRHGMEVHGIQ